MNIKSIGNPLLPFEVRSVDKNTRTEASSDRDPQQGQDRGEEAPKRNLSEAEIQAAIEYLKQHSGVKENNLNVRLAKENGVVLVFIEDSAGKVIRRIPESELSTLSRSNSSKGNIFDKAS